MIIVIRTWWGLQLHSPLTFSTAKSLGFPCLAFVINTMAILYLPSTWTIQDGLMLTSLPYLAASGQREDLHSTSLFHILRRTVSYLRTDGNFYLHKPNPNRLLGDFILLHWRLAKTSNTRSKETKGEKGKRKRAPPFRTK